MFSTREHLTGGEQPRKSPDYGPPSTILPPQSKATLGYLCMKGMNATGLIFK